MAGVEKIHLIISSFYIAFDVNHINRSYGSTGKEAEGPLRYYSEAFRNYFWLIFILVCFDLRLVMNFALRVMFLSLYLSNTRALQTKANYMLTMNEVLCFSLIRTLLPSILLNQVLASRVDACSFMLFFHGTSTGLLRIQSLHPAADFDFKADATI